MSHDNKLDLEAGYIDQQVVRNVFTTTMRKLDELIPASQSFPVKDLVTELFESAKYAILKQRKTIPEILGKTPVEIKGEAIPSQKAAHDQRVQAIKGRQ